MLSSSKSSYRKDKKESKSAEKKNTIRKKQLNLLAYHNQQLQ